jgi:CRP-like cAMP-binding protein/rhodanese-related sulfurtransferase
MPVHEVISKLGELLQPLSSATAERREQILEHARLVRFAAGKPIFQEGARDTDCVYLVKGSVDTLSGGQRLKRLDAGTSAAAVPLPDDQPRKVTAQAATDVGLLLVPRGLLAPLMARDDGGLEVHEIDEADETGDWMTMLLRSQLYAQLPAANIQRIMATMESMAVKPGDVVVRQGEIGDYFYFMSKGRARVLRQARDGDPPVLLAELREGVSFGEEALVAGIRRNATVTMTTDGRVMRLSKANFDELILEPTLQKVDWVKAQSMVNDGATWIDVRFPDEHASDGLDGAANIPLGMLRMRMPKLDRDIRYIVYCDNGQRSAAGAFLLSGSGFDVYVLEDGIITPEGIDTMDGSDLLNLVADEESSDPSAQLGATPNSLMGEFAFDAASKGSEEANAPDNSSASNASAEMAHQLRGTIDSLRDDKASVEEQAKSLTEQLESAVNELRTERTRGRKLVLELKKLRQAVTDIQRKAHVALEHERATYEAELTRAVENHERTIVQHEMRTEVEHDKAREEIERLRRLIDAPPPAKYTGG